MKYEKKYIRFTEAFALGIDYGLAFLTLDMITGKALHIARKKGLKHEDLAKKCGVDPSFIDYLDRSVQVKGAVDLIRVLDELGLILVLKKKRRKLFAKHKNKKTGDCK